MINLSEMYIYTKQAFRTCFIIFRMFGSGIKFEILVDEPVPIIVNDDLVELACGLPNSIPLAATIPFEINGKRQATIVVNRAGVELANRHNQALLYHEAGHIDLDHMKDMEKLNVFNRMSLKFNEQREMAADEYAARQVGFLATINTLAEIRTVCRDLRLNYVVQKLTKRIENLTKVRAASLA